MLNQVILTGNLGDDPSSHYTPEGLAIIRKMYDALDKEGNLAGKANPA